MTLRGAGSAETSPSTCGRRDCGFSPGHAAASTTRAPRRCGTAASATTSRASTAAASAARALSHGEQHGQRQPGGRCGRRHISNGGTAIIRNSTVSDNHGGEVDGGIATEARSSCKQACISGNSAHVGPGGIGNGGTATLQDSTVSGNSTGLGNGGGIGNGGTMTLQGSTVSGNHSNGGSAAESTTAAS